MTLNRKDFLRTSAAAAAGAVFASPLSAFASSEQLIFSQSPLSYGFDALEPYIDKATMEIHYGKHHAAYITNANDALRDEKVTSVSETELFKSISKYSPKLRNNAGGAWNHTQFWSWMKPGPVEIPANVSAALSGSFGSVDAFKADFAKAAMGRFGSGWAWLVKTPDGKLVISSTPNQDNPLMDVAEVKGTPLLGLDVWEHAYYLKYQNKRAEYISNWWNVVNWNKTAAAL